MTQTKAQLLDGKSATIQFTGGSASAPAISFTGDTNTGIYSPGADQVAISTNGAGRLFVDDVGRVGIGLTPGSGGFNLDVRGISLSSGPTLGVSAFDFNSGASSFTGTFLRQSGSAATGSTSGLSNARLGSLTFQNGSAGLIRTNGAVPIVFATTDSERLRITSDGKLGLGSSVPVEALTTKGSIAVGDTVNCGVKFYDASPVASALRWWLANNPGDSDALSLFKYDASGNYGGNAIKVESNGSINVDGGGLYYDASTNRLAVGTTSPDAKLEIVESSTGETEVARFRLEGQTNNPMLRIFADEANKLLTIGTSGSTSGSELRFNTKPSTTESARIDSSGRLLVGTSSSRANYINSTLSALLQVEGTGFSNSSISTTRNSNDAFGSAVILNKSRGTTIGSNSLVSSGDELGRIIFEGNDATEFVEGARIEAFVDGTPGANDMPGRLVFSTTADGASSPTEAMRINNAGDICVGVAFSTPGSANTNTGVGLTKTGSLFASRTAAVTANFNRNTSDGDLVSFRREGNQVGSISVTTTATAYNTSSDYRLKENVTAVTDGITRLQQLKPSRFNFITDPSKTVDGFIAHEVQVIVPEAITGEKDAVDDKGNPVYQGIDQSKLVPLLTAALQEAIGEIESLKARVAALETP